MIIKKFGKKSINILLFGVSCVGKTTVGKLLADKLGWLFFDVDDGIVKHCGCSIGEFVCKSSQTHAISTAGQRRRWWRRLSRTG